MQHVIGTCDCWSCETRYLQIEAGTCEPLEDAFERFIRLLEEAGIAITEDLCVAAVLADLCELGGIPTPLCVSAAVREIA